MGMEVLISMLLCFLQFNTVDLLQCYHCKATNEEACKSKQTLSKCSFGKEGACYSFSYKSYKDNDYELTFNKGCWESFSNCETYCSHPGVIDDAEDCKAECCVGDNCNYQKEKEIVRDKKKRATNQHSSALKRCQSPIFILFGVLLFVHIL